MKYYQFIQNNRCEYFPCHKDVDIQTFNCLFCYCPLYMLGDRCGGHFFYNEAGIKDCSGCELPHKIDGYDFIQSKIQTVIDQVRQELPEKIDERD